MKKLYVSLLCLLPFFAIAQFPDPYCAEAYSLSVEPITRVKIANIDNASSATIDGPAHEDFTAVVINLNAGSNYTLEVEGNTNGPFTTYVRAFIDLNQDGDFDDAAESFDVGTIFSSTGLDGVKASYSFTLPVITPAGSYRLRLGKKFASFQEPCNVDGYGQAEDYTVNVAVPSCFAPTNAVAGNLTANSADLSWSAPLSGDPVTQYNWEVRTSGAPGSGAAGLFSSGNVTDPALTAVSLSPLTSYGFYVRSDCGAGSTSDWSGVSFTTACEAVLLPYLENFESITAPDVPECMVVEDVNADGVKWETFGALPPNIPTNAARMGFNANIAADDWLFTPRFTLTGGTSYMLRFKYKASNGADGWVENLEVKYGAGQSAAQMTSAAIFQEEGIASNAADPYSSVMVFFTPAADGIYSIGFHQYSDADQAFLYVDDIRLEETPTCFPPTDVSASSVLITTASLSWTDPTLGDPVVLYNWELRTSGEPGSGAAGLVTSGSGNDTINLTDLTPATDYVFYVRTDCGGGSNSEWASVAFKTSCDVVALPYLEDFESVTAPEIPACVVIEDVNKDGITWATFGPLAPDVPSVAARMIFNADQAADDWMFTPLFNLTGGVSYQLKFKYKASNGADGWVENLEVKYGKGQNAADMTSDAIFQEEGIASNVTDPYTNATVYFTPAADGIYSLGFHQYSDPDQAFLYVDDIQLRETPSCLPPSAVSISDLTLTGATASWTAPDGSSPAAQYSWEVRTSGLPGSGPDGLAASGTEATVSAAITLLSSGFTYTFYVRSNCEDATNSDWTEGVQFTTLCDITALPYFEDFDSVEPPAIPNCTRSEDVNQDGITWQTNLAVPDLNIPTQCLVCGWNANLDADDWFFTPKFALTAGTNYELTFKYKGSDGDLGFVENMLVKYGTGQTAADMTSDPIFQEIDISSALADEYTVATVIFTVPADGNYNLGFYKYSFADNSFILVDDIRVRIAPSCLPPPAVTITAITANSALANWTAPSGSSPTVQYEWEIRTSGAPGSGAAGLFASGTELTLSYALAALNPNTSYTFYVRTSCEDLSESDWTAGNSFVTTCDPPLDLPYTEDFDSVTVPEIPECMRVQDGFSDKVAWATFDAFPPELPTQSIRKSWSATHAADEWFFTPMLNFAGSKNYVLTFKYKASDGPDFVENLEVKYGTGQSADQITSAAIFTEEGISTAVGDDYAEASVVFSVPADGAYTVGFHCYSEIDQAFLYVDDVHIELEPLPVTGLELKGQRIASNVQLTWRTVTEINNQGFELQHSPDGHNYSKIAFVGTKASNGNSNAALDYLYNDAKPFNGANYYRIKQLDKDGKAHFSNVVVVKGIRPAQVNFSNLYPNPAKNILSASIESPKNGNVTFVFTDMAGKVLKLQNAGLTAGDNLVKLNVSNLPSGSYLVKVICSDGCETAIKKFVKL